MHTREMEADDKGNVVTEVVIVATDIEAPKAVAFAKWEGRDGVTARQRRLTQSPSGRTAQPWTTNDNPADSHDG